MPRQYSAKDSVSASTLRAGVDTGGTFTDFIVIASDGLTSFKVPSTPQSPTRAILEGIRHILSALYPPGRRLRRLELVHGTTVATNALLERKVARTALVTTEGFEDVIEIGRQARPDLYNLAGSRPEPLIPRNLRFGIRERIAADGSVIASPDAELVNRFVEKLRRARVESVAISLLFSFANPAHEQIILEALAPLNIPISVSHLILPEYREYERTSTVVINACLTPRVGQYLVELGRQLDAVDSALGVSHTALRVMQSSGGSISADVAAKEPVRTILSGPAGGVIAATKIAALAGESDILTFDMGGTSTDVAICRGGAQTTSEARISGLPVAVPVLDIHTVGAGGGSIAEVDAGGALRVGPESAGADPGPACYGTGVRATVTDANLILGRLGDAGLLGGSMTLDHKRAAAALEELAARMSEASNRRIDRNEAALGVIRVVNANMEAALRLVSIQRGHDPRRFALVSFGGAGGLHAATLAASLRIPKVIIPENPGAFSALGVLLAEVVRDYTRTVMIEVTEDKDGRSLLAKLRKHMSALARNAVYDLRAEGFKGERMRVEGTLAMRYVGQSFELDIPCGIDVKGFPTEAFHRAHRERYGHSDPAQKVEIVSVRVRGIGLTGVTPGQRADRFRRFEARPDRQAPVTVSRRVQKIPLFERQNLAPGAHLSGPALLTEYGATTFVPPAWQVGVDGWRNLILTGRDG